MITSVLVHEPAGNRSMQLPLLIGSTSDCEIRVPGFGDDERVRLFAEGEAVYLDYAAAIERYGKIEATKQTKPK